MKAVKPSQYEPHMDKIFRLAGEHNIKLLPELHGAPGSQNGEIHSGCVTGPEVNGGKPEHYFNTEWNKEIAVRAVAEMAAKCLQYPGTCWGIGILNEPQPAGFIFRNIVKMREYETACAMLSWIQCIQEKVGLTD